MGRPLFSITYSSPAVRTEPEPNVIPYEKWSYWNPFDPDSDEFNADPILEHFIDPHQESEGGEQAMVVDVLRTDGSDSSTSSDGSSERGSPMAVGADDPARMLAEAYPAVDWDEPTRNGREIRASRQRSATINILPAGPPRTPRSMITSNAIETLPRTSNITPINVPIRRPPAEWTVNTFAPLSPSTPTSRTTFNAVTPSPAPTATPTLLSWPSRPPVVPPSPSPNANGPLTNPSARMSLAHIAPTLIRVRD